MEAPVVRSTSARPSKPKGCPIPGCANVGDDAYTATLFHYVSLPKGGFGVKV